MWTRVPVINYHAMYYDTTSSSEHYVSSGLDYMMLQVESGILRGSQNYAWKDGAYNTSGAGSNVPGRRHYYTKAYGVLNGRLTFEYTRIGDREPVRIAFWGKNLLDSRKPVYSVGLGDSGNGYFNSDSNWQEPLSLGIELSYCVQGEPYPDGSPACRPG